MDAAVVTRVPRRLPAVRSAPWLSIEVATVAVGLAFLPVLVPPLPGNAAPVDVLLLCATAAVLLWAGANGQRLLVPYALPVAILVASGAVSALLGEFPVLGAVALLQDITVLAWCAAVANVARSPGALSVLMRVWSWSAIAWATILVLAVVTRHAAIAGFIEGGQRAAFTLGNPNRAGSYFVVSLMVVLAADRPRTLARRLAGGAVVLAAIVLTGSNSALGGVLVAAILAIFLGIQRRRGLIPALAAMALAAVVSMAAVTYVIRHDLIDQAHASSNSLVRNSIGRSERSSEDRAVQLSQLVTLFSKEGPFGNGPAATKDVLALSGAWYVKEAHNDFAAVLTERGVLGALGLLILIGAVGYRGVTISDKLSPLFAEVVRTTPLLGALAAVGVSSVFHEVLHYRHVWALFGLVAALHLWGRDGSRSGEEPW
jgi:cell division protein FtsW (lipid II flippase)